MRTIPRDAWFPRQRPGRRARTHGPRTIGGCRDPYPGRDRGEAGGTTVFRDRPEEAYDGGVCLGVPGCIASEPDPVTGMGRVSFAGVEKEICLLYVPEANVGEYVLVHAGFAISRIDEEEAEATLAALEALGEPTRPETGDETEEGRR